VSVVFAIGGCSESRRLVLELEEIYLEAPNGNRVPLGLPVDVTRNGFTRAAILSSEAYFRRGDRPKEPIVLLESTDSHYPDKAGTGLGGSTHRLVLEAPAALVALSASEPGDPEVEYTLHLSFRLGDKRWVHHMRFRVEVRSDWYFAAPATP
jgi:hypothetical protein